jgi:hypothetical protein
MLSLKSSTLHGNVQEFVQLFSEQECNLQLKVINLYSDSVSKN